MQYETLCSDIGMQISSYKKNFLKQLKHKKYVHKKNIWLSNVLEREMCLNAT